MCSVLSMAPGADIAKIRSRYLAHAVQRARKMAAISEVSAKRAAEELRNYFEWIEELLPVEDKHKLSDEIEGLTKRHSADPRLPTPGTF
jgi:hypothetical protein